MHDWPGVCRRIASFSSSSSSAGPLLVDGRGAERVARERRRRRRARALADRVADDDRPAALVDPEYVVEVAADHLALARRAVVDRRFDSGDPRHLARHQALLKRRGDPLERVLDPRRWAISAASTSVVTLATPMKSCASSSRSSGDCPKRAEVVLGQRDRDPGDEQDAATDARLPEAQRDRDQRRDEGR